MGCKSSKLCPVSLGIAIGFTAMLSLWVMLIWGAYASNEAMITYMHQMMAPVEGMPFWKIYLIVFLKGFFFGFFIAAFYDLCRCICNKMCRKSCETGACNCNCGCSCCGKK